MGFFDSLLRTNPNTEKELIEGGEQALLGHEPSGVPEDIQLSQEPTNNASFEGSGPVAGSPGTGENVGPVTPHQIDPITGTVHGVGSTDVNYSGQGPVAGEGDNLPAISQQALEGEVLPATSVGGAGGPPTVPAETGIFSTPGSRGSGDVGDYERQMEMLPNTIPTKSPVSLKQLAALGLVGAGVGFGGAAALDNKKSNSQPSGKVPAKMMPQGTPSQASEQAPAENGLVRQQTKGTTKTSGVTPIAPEVKGTANSSDSNTLDSPPVDPLNTVQGLREAQSRENNAVFGNQLGRAGDLIGAGIAGHGAKPVAQDIFNDQIKEAGSITKDFEGQVAQQKNDPKSQVSQDFRNYIKQFGVTLPPNTSANSAEKIMPFAFKKFEATEAQQARHEDNRYRYDNLTAQKEIAAGQREQAAKDKKDLEEEKAYTEASNKAQSYRSNPEVRQASANMLSTKNALALVEGKDPDKLSTQDLALLTQELGKIASGGVTTDSGFQHLAPHTINTELARWESFLSNKPSDAEAGAFIRHNIKYLKDMQKISENSLNGFHDATLAGYQHRMRPERYQELRTRFGLNNQQAATNNPPVGHAESGKMAPDDNGAPGMVVQDQPRFAQPQAPGAPQNSGGMVHIRNKSTGKVKAFTADQAAKYLQDPNFESVQ